MFYVFALAIESPSSIKRERKRASIMRESIKYFIASCKTAKQLHQHLYI